MSPRRELPCSVAVRRRAMPQHAPSPYRSAPLVDDEVADRSACVEVVARWGDEFLAVAHLRAGERFTLVSTAATGALALALPDVDDAWVLAEHTADGCCIAHRHQRADGDAGGVLARGEAHAQTLGAVTLVVRHTWSTGTAARQITDPGARATLAMAVALLVVALVGAVALRGRNRGQGRAMLDEVEDDRRVLRALMARWPEAPGRRSGDAGGVTPTPTPAELPHVTGESVPRAAQNRGVFVAGLLRPTGGPYFGLMFEDLVSCVTRVDGVWESDAELGDALWRHATSRWLHWRVRFRARVRAGGVVDEVQLSRGREHWADVLSAVSRVRTAPTAHDRVSVCCINQGCEGPELGE